MAETEDVTPESSTEKPEKSGPPAEALSTDTPDDKGTYVPRTRLNKANEEARAATEKAAALQERLEALEARLSNQPSAVDSDPEVAGAKKLIEETANPLIERQSAALRKELAEAQKKLDKAVADSQRASQEAQWQRMCAKVGADPDNKELMAVTSGLYSTGNYTEADALKRAVEYLKPKAGARVETDGITGETITSDWVPKTDAEARAGAKKGKLARHLTSLEIIQARKAR